MPTITVATINLHGRNGRWRQRRHLLVEQLLNADPDLISLQEISFPIRQGHWLKRQLNERLATREQQPYQLIQKRRRHLIEGYKSGIGILTRLPTIYHEVIPLGHGGRIGLRLNIRLPNGQPLDFVATHLHNIAHHDEVRLEQAMKLTGWLNRYRRIPLQIIAGDFNEQPAGPAIRYMRQGYQSAYARKHKYEPLATYPTLIGNPHRTQGLCLDYIFLSPTIQQVIHAAIFADEPDNEDNTLYPSDHVGIIATLRV